MTDRKKWYCSICGAELKMTVDHHYISRDKGTCGLATIVRNDEETLYDTFDCPECGCQNIAQERKRKFFINDENIDNDEEEDDDGEDE